MKLSAVIILALSKILIVYSATCNVRLAKGHWKQIACLVIPHLIGPYSKFQKSNVSIKRNVVKILAL